MLLWRYGNRHARSREVDDETIKQSAKAIRAIAKTTNTAIEAGRDVGGWLNRVFGKAIIDTVGLVWTDRVAARRIEAAIYDWKRIQHLFHKVDLELKRRRVKRTRALSPKIAIPLLEHASMETDRELQRLWVNLLATGLMPKGEVRPLCCTRTISPTRTQSSKGFFEGSARNSLQDTKSFVIENGAAVRLVRSRPPAR
jgi:hypothetical protein